MPCWSKKTAPFLQIELFGLWQSQKTHVPYGHNFLSAWHSFLNTMQKRLHVSNKETKNYLVCLPEKVDDRKILTSDGGLGGMSSMSPSSIASNFFVMDLISGNTVKTKKDWKFYIWLHFIDKIWQRIKSFTFLLFDLFHGIMARAWTSRLETTTDIERGL